MNMVITGRMAVGRASHRAASKRREIMWAWLSLVVLVLCWDTAARLDDAVTAAAPGSLISQNALSPVSARPTVN